MRPLASIGLSALALAACAAAQGAPSRVLATGSLGETATPTGP